LNELHTQLEVYRNEIHDQSKIEQRNNELADEAESLKKQIDLGCGKKIQVSDDNEKKDDSRFGKCTDASKAPAGSFMTANKIELYSASRGEILYYHGVIAFDSRNGILFYSNGVKAFDGGYIIIFL
jgi:hypothetical protein